MNFMVNILAWIILDNKPTQLSEFVVQGFDYLEPTNTDKYLIISNNIEQKERIQHNYIIRYTEYKIESVKQFF